MKAKIKISIDGGLTFQSVSMPIRVVYESLVIDDGREVAELHLSLSDSGILSDLWVLDPKQAERNLGSDALSLRTLVNRARRNSILK